MDYIGWLIVFIVFAAIELVTLGLTCIWFSIGALAACVVSLFTDNWILQALVFVVVTILVLVFLRPIAVKHLNSKAEKTNVDSVIGKTGKVVVEINNVNATGMISLNGVEWTARSADNHNIEKDALVEVVSVEGVKVIVKKI